MGMKIFSAVVAVGLFVVFNGAIALKLKEFSLVVVMMIGFSMMIFDLYESLKSKD